MDKRSRWSQHRGRAKSHLVVTHSAPRRWLRNALPDLGHAFRQLRRAPGSTAFIVGILALGIGANVTMAGVIDRLLFRPPDGVHDPGRVARLVFETPGLPRAGSFMGYPQFLTYSHDVTAFEDVAAFTNPRNFLLGGGADAADVTASLVSASFFPLLGVSPALGRAFTPADGFPEGMTSGGPALAVLEHGFWRRQFGSDSTVIGRALRVGTISYTVVGIASPGFRGPTEEAPDIWLPITVAAESVIRPAILEERGSSWLSVVARIRNGVSRATAEQQATRVARRDAHIIAPYNEVRVVAASLIRGRGPDAPREVTVALWLGGISALVLLIACANVANLLLARAFTRRREIAVRLALGAGRGRLARQLLSEACALAALGGGAALALAAVGGGFVRRYFPAANAGGEFVDARVFAFTAAVALGTGVMVSLAPLVQSAVPDLTHTLRSGATTGGGRSSRVRATLLAGQAALCMLLLVVAALFAHSLHRVQGLDLGVDVDRTVVAYFDLDEPATTRAGYESLDADLLERVTAVPGVARAAFGAAVNRAVAVHTSTRRLDRYYEPTSGVPYEISVGSGYFRTLGTSSLRGRDFTPSDMSGAPLVAIINEPLARRLFPGEEPLGQCIYLPLRAGGPSGDCWTVAGVLQGFRYPRNILARDGLLVYTPLAQRYELGRPGSMHIAIAGAPATVIPAVRNAIVSARPELLSLDIRWMRDVIEPEMRPWRLGASMFSLFGSIALVIAAVGLYAVVASSAAQRSSEIAVRIALGARDADVFTVVAGSGLRAIIGGLVIGTGAALAIGRWLDPLLFETSARDPRIFFAVAALLLGVATIASLIPTARALRRSPAAILRVD